MKESNPIKCEICDRKFKSLGSLQLHLGSHRNIDLERYYINFINHNANTECRFCRNPAQFKGFTKGYMRICKDIECYKKSIAPFSKEYKMMIDGLSEEEYEKWSKEDREIKKRNTEEGFRKKREKDKDFDKKNSRYCREYWINKGYSEDESINLAHKEIQKNRDKLKKILSNDPNYMKGKSWVSIDYWIKKGYTREDALSVVSQKQKTFSKEICIQKYGMSEGERRWAERQKKWLDKMDSKSDEEKLEILEKKMFLNTKFSKNSQMLFNMISSRFEKNISEQFKYHENGTEEKIILENKYIFSVDFMYKNKIIEFYGDYWHFNPEIYKSDYVTKRGGKTIKAAAKWKMDGWRKSLLEKNGYSIIIVWEKEFNEHPCVVLEKCIKFLTND